MKRTILGIVAATMLALATVIPASAAYYRHGYVHRPYYGYHYRPYYSYGYQPYYGYYRPYYGYGYGYRSCNYYYGGCYYNYGYDYGSNWPFFGIFGSHHH
jgi:hypothetical protein